MFRRFAGRVSLYDGIERIIHGERSRADKSAHRFFWNFLSMASPKCGGWLILNDTCWCTMREKHVTRHVKHTYLRCRAIRRRACKWIVACNVVGDAPHAGLVLQEVNRLVIVTESTAIQSSLVAHLVSFVALAHLCCPCTCGRSVASSWKHLHILEQSLLSDLASPVDTSR
jgi:hypothetical protein